MKDLAGKTALVTGASRGIGAALAVGLAERGAHVILSARTVSGLERTDDAVKAAGGSATILPLDLKKENNLDYLGPTLYERFGGLDILLANAGMLGGLRSIAQHSPKVWQDVFQVNLHANFLLLRTLDPLLRKSESGFAGFVTTQMTGSHTPYWGLYAASKAALEHMAQTYQEEVKHSPLKVKLIDPGIVHTKMLDEAFPGGFPGETLSPEQAAETILSECFG